MPTEDFPGNPHPKAGKTGKQAQSTEPKVHKIIQGEVVRRRKPLGRRFAETFVEGEARSVWSHVAFEVLLPAAKDMIEDTVQEGISRMLWGESSRGRRSSRRGGGSGIFGNQSYHGAYGRREEPERRNISRQARAMHNFEEILLPSRAEADEVIKMLFELVSQYEVARVSDLYSLVGISSNYTEEKWGWYDIRGAQAVRLRGGDYLLDLPRPVPLD